MRFSTLVLALLVLVACQPVPRPFEANPGTPNELLVLADSRGIMVLPVADAPPATAQKLATEMAAALIDRNVPAFVNGGNRSSMILAGEVIDPGRDAIIAWTLFNPKGEEVARHDQSIEGTPVDLWAVAEPELMARLAATSAPSIAKFVQNETVREIKAPPIFVGDVRGTNERDAIRLQVSLRQALRSQGARVANSATDETLVATADVVITPLPDDQSEVAIAWVVKDPFETQIGKIDQASPIDRSVIETQWGDLARQAGIAAATGMVRLISQIDWSKGFVPPGPESGKPNGESR